ncbi:MAG: RNA-binding transcriptional accessory protein [Bacteroidetes bacterium GWF2_42_66]|nr:MAG: RNA-binding transcriptional accessory protein [Bacteroidetes bacterium GWA2_42_15]OFX96281.1 MAG: RNA-binding transcriptional accessory protein [Bacteroidetes bacterium GWE2_42_39]OFY46320.1 MAG: RNA-binding transcriptional accessory protein [Bacteroidetes bacterium GWF2_42_66]HBL78297.1 RNA-binding transcriptional accessory protein [Prolixibacteraceae bacterium]HCR92180.1 RNA-binding transcriptional accessory protein [Prolixibacteraceae bacterium]
MTDHIFRLIAQKLGIQQFQVKNTCQLFDEGATVPFISRYRKERTGSLDEVQVAAVKDEMEKFSELIKRKEIILKTIEEQELLTAELKTRIDDCYDPVELEDIYLPYKPKRKTRASMAREKGLEPLAKIIMKQYEPNPEFRAASFLNDQVETVEDALSGGRDIIAEWISENEKARNIVRQAFSSGAVICSKVAKGKEEEGVKYQDYYNWEEPLKRCPSHRLLAMRRGENEGILNVSVSPENQNAIERLERFFVKSDNDCGKQLEFAVKDAYKRLLEPSIETEFAQSSKEKADEEAIRVFVENLRQLLLAAPLGQKRVLALDPGYRTGCKVVCLDAQGNLLHNETIYPHKPQEETKLAAKKIVSMVEAYQIEAIAIGNGTASRETEQFIKRLHFDREMRVFVVSEDGASIYSASKIARDEFPQYDVTVRGAISIGRRLMDPLAELVKIDPKSIGVGQYQHDVDQKKLKNSLDLVVESCVNNVGVDLNTASKHLLTYISGLGPQLAQNIVDYRKENGAFASRKELMKVPRMGAKAFEQSAGFLRIADAENPLDNSAVHPESYSIVEKMASDLNCSVSELMKDTELQKKIVFEKYITPTVGLPTLQDIKQELGKPGRDPRKAVKVFEFADGIFKVEDLQVGMVLPGIVTNITKFGAFVDVGVKQDGLVHLSQIANRFISDPNEIVKLHQHVQVKVIEVDIQRKRIQLSLKQASGEKETTD